MVIVEAMSVQSWFSFYFILKGVLISTMKFILRNQSGLKMTVGLSMKPCVLNAELIDCDYNTVLYTIDLPKTQHYKLTLPEVH